MPGSPLPLSVPTPPAPEPLWRLLLDAALFGISGIVLLIIGYYVWELITPYNVRRELHENKNVEHHRVDLVDLVFADQVSDGRVGDQDLHGEDSARCASARDQ